MTAASLHTSAGVPFAISSPCASTWTCSHQVHDRLHDMLDHEDGDAVVADRPDHRNDVADLGRVEPGQHFVEKQKLRLGRQRARQLQALASGHRQA